MNLTADAGQTLCWLTLNPCSDRHPLSRGSIKVKKVPLQLPHHQFYMNLSALLNLIFGLFFIPKDFRRWHILLIYRQVYTISHFQSKSYSPVMIKWLNLKWSKEVLFEEFMWFWNPTQKYFGKNIKWYLRITIPILLRGFWLLKGFSKFHS